MGRRLVLLSSETWGHKKSESETLASVPRVGLEPTRPNGHMALNHACLHPQHLAVQGLVPLVVTRLGLEPRTLSLKVRCSNQLSYQVFFLR